MEFWIYDDNVVRGIEDDDDVDGIEEEVGGIG